MFTLWFASELNGTTFFELLRQWPGFGLPG